MFYRIGVCIKIIWASSLTYIPMSLESDETEVDESWKVNLEIALLGNIKLIGLYFLYNVHYQRKQ